MSSRKWLKLCLLSTPCAGLFLLPISLASCSVEKKEITLANSEFYSIQRECSIPFSTTLPTNTNVHVEIDSYDKDLISIINPDITIVNEQNKVDLIVSENVRKNKDFHFNLIFTLPGTSQKIVSQPLTIFFSYKEEEQDGIRAEQVNVSSTNSYTFDYSFKFQYEPQSDVTVDLVSDYSQTLSLASWGSDQETCCYTQVLKPVSRDYWYFIDLSVFMKVSVFVPKNAPFSLRFTFTNSKGKEQQTIINGLCASLFFHPNQEIPADFFNLEEDENNLIRLNGFKKMITSEQLKMFPILHIPDNVDVVDSLELYHDNFLPDLFFDKIIIGKNVKHFSEGALKNCTGISQIDVSTKDPTDSITFGKNVFNDQIFENYGKIILPNCTDEQYDKWTQLFTQLGFQTDVWGIDQVNLVLPEECYVTEYDVKLEGYRLTSIANNGNLSKYSIINIPNDVVAINGDAFTNLIQNPFVPDQSQPYDYGNRFLSLPKKLKTIDCDEGDACFSNMCLTGLVNIPEDLKELPINCFNAADDIKVEHSSYTKKKFEIRFHKNSAIENLGNSCLANLGIESITFPSTISVVDSDVLKSCEYISTLDFSQYKTIPQWLSSEGEDDNSYFTKVGASITEKTKTIVVSAAAATEDNWQDLWWGWLNKHGLLNPDQWIFDIKDI